jgi:hypothetical protein
LTRPRILKADPVYRRRFLLGYSLFFALAVLMFLALSQWGMPALSRYLERQAPAEALRVLDLMLKTGVLLGVSLGIAVSASTFWRGWHARATGQLPAPGTRVLRDTPILEGAAAVRRGTLMMTMSVVFAVVLLSVAVTILLLWDLSRLSPAHAR